MPAAPRRYFDEATTAALSPYLATLARERDPDLLRDVPEFTVAPARAEAWQATATLLYANWLGLVVGEAAEEPERSPPRGSASLASRRASNASSAGRPVEAAPRPAG